MKHKLTVFVCLVAVVVVSILTVQTYNRHQHAQALTNAKLSASIAKQSKLQKEAAANYNAAVIKLNNFCKAVVTNPTLVQSAERVKIQVPTCNL